MAAARGLWTPSSTSIATPSLAKAAFIRREAALGSEARMAGVLLTENCVPSMAASRNPL